MERLIGSWLERLLASRRSREIFFGIFILFHVFDAIYCADPASICEEAEIRIQLSSLRWSKYLAPFPPLIVSAGHRGSGSPRFRRILHSACRDSPAFVLFFSALLWQRYAAQYRGEELSETAAPAPCCPEAVRWRAPAPGASNLRESYERCNVGSGIVAADD